MLLTKAGSDVKQAWQELARLVAGIAEDQEAPLVAELPLGLSSVLRRPEHIHLRAVRDVVDRQAAGRGDLLAEATHGHRNVRRLEEVLPPWRQIAGRSGPVNREIEQ